MAKVVVIGAGFAGHTAALYLGDALGKKHEITVINKYEKFVFIPSLVWVGVGHMDVKKVGFLLKPVYDKMHIRFVHGEAREIHPEENFVMVMPRDGSGDEPVRVDYDYLVIATGPYLDFDATEGLGPKHGATYSICTPPHAEQARDQYLEVVERMKKGEKQRLVIGVGHALSACHGAAFEYISNIHKDLVKKGVRDKATLTFLSNERALGDFGVRGITARRKGKMITSDDFIGAIFREFDIHSELRKAPLKAEKGCIYWEDYDGREGTTEFDFAMLIPLFKGQPLRYIGADGEDISDKLISSNGMVLVDGIYGLPYDTLKENPDAWPSVYQNTNFRNIFAAGIAFAPPGSISVPHVNPKGRAITASPPRTGMMSGIIGRVVAKNIIDLVERGRMTHHERMSEMLSVCIASMGDSLWDGLATVAVIYPVVPDVRKFPNEQGRDLFVTHLETGLAGAWMKRMIHSTFIHKLQGRVGWKIIPE